MPTKRKVRTDVMLCCLALSLWLVVQAVPLPVAYAGPQYALLQTWLTGLWLGWRCILLQRTSRQRWHLMHNTATAMTAQDVERLYA